MFLYLIMLRLKLIREWKLLFIKKKIMKITKNKALLLANLIINNYLN